MKKRTICTEFKETVKCLKECNKGDRDKQKMEEYCNKAGMYVYDMNAPFKAIFLIFLCIIHMDYTDDRAVHVTENLIDLRMKHQKKQN